MDMEVVGRHALLFDDDATAAFVNSSDALVEWNSLLIDRYDVRHLLQNPPQSFRRRRQQTPASSSSPLHGSSLESELDNERYLDLPQSSDEQQETDNGAEGMAGAYHTVAFSYGNPNGPIEQSNPDASFRPPFPVPESLLQHLVSKYVTGSYSQIFFFSFDLVIIVHALLILNRYWPNLYKVRMLF